MNDPIPLNNNFDASPIVGFISGEKLHNTLLQIVDPFEENGLQGLAYAIRVGDRAYISEEDPIKYDVFNPIRILPSREVIIRSLETLAIPSDMFGLVFPTQAYASKAILVVTANIIEPGRHGYIFFTISNQSDTEISISYGETIASIIFYQLPFKLPVPPTTFIDQLPHYERPKLTDRELPPYIELVRQVQQLSSDVEVAKQNSRILLGYEFERYPTLLARYNSSYIYRDGYCLRAGDEATTIYPDDVQRRDLRGQNTRKVGPGEVIEILPGKTIVIKTMEKVALRADMSAFVSPLSNLSAKYINFDGRHISPRYSGFIWLQLHNYGSVDAVIKPGDPIAFITFTLLGRAPIERQDNTHLPFPSIEVDDLPFDDVPKKPSSDWYTLVELGEKVKVLENEVKGFGPTKAIIDLIFLAGLAGIIAGLVILVLPAALSDMLNIVNNNSPTNGMMMIIVFAIIMAILFFVFKRK
jgi:deoxycytidine triphosphate deaminase